MGSIDRAASHPAVARQQSARRREGGYKTTGADPGVFRKSAFRYLNSHGALDQDHMKFFESLMNRVDDPSDQSAIVEMAKDMFRLFGGMFAGIEIEGVRDAA